jgi:hypothetical protein
MVSESGELTKNPLQLIAPANKKSIKTAASAENFLLLFDIFSDHHVLQMSLNQRL